MSSTMEKVSANKVKLRMELEAEAFENALQQAYLKLRGRINVQGFRKGRAPRKMIERIYGESIFYEEAFDSVFPDLYDETVKENDLNTVGQPDVQIDTIGGGEPLVVTAEVYIYPEVTLGLYKGLAVDRPDDTVDDEAVDQEIGRVRQRNAREEEIESRPVQDDDIVTLDYAGTIDGVPFDGGSAEGQQLTIGSGQFIPGFEEQMVGMSIGEEKDITVSFPEDYHAEELAGKAAVFHVKVHSIRTRELPDLDDEFAKDVSEFDTLDDYKADIRAQLQEEATNRANATFENDLVKAAIDNATIDVPPPMVDRQVDQMLQDMALRLAYQGVSMENFLEYTGQTIDQLREQYRDDALEQVKGQLVLEAIRKAEDIEPTDAEIQDVMERYAKQRDVSVEEFKETLTEQQQAYIKEDAATIAVLALLKNEAVPAAADEDAQGVDAQPEETGDATAPEAPKDEA